MTSTDPGIDLLTFEEHRPQTDFAYWTSQPHFLVVDELPPDIDDANAPDDFIVEHPDGCPGADTAWGCGISVERAMVGLRTFFRHRDEPAPHPDSLPIVMHDHSVPVAPGRHQIHAWFSGSTDLASHCSPDPVEDDCISGLALVDPDDPPHVLPRPASGPTLPFDGVSHWLIVSERAPELDCGDDALDIAHPDGCSGADDHYGCGVSEVVHAVGLRFLFRHRDELGVGEHDDAVPLPPGRHEIRSWHSGPDHNGEYDAGLRLATDTTVTAQPHT